MLLLDQTKLPHQQVWLTITTWQQAADAINQMAVRGAPAISICASYALVLAAKNGENVLAVSEELLKTRPTAVNLQNALARLTALGSLSAENLEPEAIALEAEDKEICNKIATHGLSILPHQPQILTICNTGALATAGDGTAMAVIKAAHRDRLPLFVWSCETRPRLQGLKLTAWELQEEGIPFASVVDSAAGLLMAQGKVNVVIVGADRIAANGDTANKIGTYMLAVLAKHHQIPFYVAAPSTTFDPTCYSSNQIPIEERASSEITQIMGQDIASPDIPVYNPAFDVTPAALITGFITEHAASACLLDCFPGNYS